MSRLRRLLLCLGFGAPLGGTESPLEIPRPADDRIVVTLYASDPDIVTPIGAASSVPDLSVIGRTAHRAQLVRSIVRPSDDIAPQFQGWEIRRTNGDVITGLQGHIRTGRGVSIIPLEGRETVIPDRDVAHFGPLEGSLMPAGLEGLLSIEEFRDLIAFLASRK